MLVYNLPPMLWRIHRGMNTVKWTVGSVSTLLLLTVLVNVPVARYVLLVLGILAFILWKIHRAQKESEHEQEDTSII